MGTLQKPGPSWDRSPFAHSHHHSSLFTLNSLAPAYPFGAKLTPAIRFWRQTLEPRLPLGFPDALLLQLNFALNKHDAEVVMICGWGRMCAKVDGKGGYGLGWPKQQFIGRNSGFHRQ